MNPNIKAVYLFLISLAVAGVFLWSIHWTLAGICFAFAASHLMMFNIGRLVEADTRGNGGPVRRISRGAPDELPDGRPESLASRVTRHNKKNKGWGEVVKHSSDSILNY